MNKKPLLTAVLLLLVSSGLSGCASVSSPYTYQGAAAGGALGAVAGALIDGHNRWRGAVIGGALGSAMGAASSEVAARSARHASQQEYRSYQGSSYGYTPSSYQSGYYHDRW